MVEVERLEFYQFEISSATLSKLEEAGAFVSKEAEYIVDAVKQDIDVTDRNSGFVFLYWSDPARYSVDELYCTAKRRQGIGARWQDLTTIYWFSRSDPDGCFNLGGQLWRSVMRMYSEEVALLVSPYDAVLFASYPEAQIAQKYGGGVFDPAWLLTQKGGHEIADVLSAEHVAVDYVMPVIEQRVDENTEVKTLAIEAGIDWRILRAVNYDTIEDAFSVSADTDVLRPARPRSWEEIPIFGTPSDMTDKVYGDQQFEGVVRRIIDIVTEENEAAEFVFLPRFEESELLLFKDVVGFSKE